MKKQKLKKKPEEKQKKKLKDKQEKEQDNNPQLLAQVLKIFHHYNHMHTI